MKLKCTYLKSVSNIKLLPFYQQTKNVATIFFYILFEFFACGTYCSYSFRLHTAFVAVVGGGGGVQFHMFEALYVCREHNGNGSIVFIVCYSNSPISLYIYRNHHSNLNQFSV